MAFTSAAGTTSPLSMNRVEADAWLAWFGLAVEPCRAAGGLVDVEDVARPASGELLGGDDLSAASVVEEGDGLRAGGGDDDEMVRAG